MQVCLCVCACVCACTGWLSGGNRALRRMEWTKQPVITNCHRHLSTCHLNTNTTQAHTHSDFYTNAQTLGYFQAQMFRKWFTTTHTHMETSAGVIRPHQKKKTEKQADSSTALCWGLLAAFLEHSPSLLVSLTTLMSPTRSWTHLQLSVMDKGWKGQTGVGWMDSESEDQIIYIYYIYITTQDYGFVHWPQ